MKACMTRTTVSLQALLKAQKRFETFRQRLRDEQDKAGAIQAFEFCFELAWKTMKKKIEQMQSESIIGPRDTFRAGALFKLIDDAEVWFTFLDYRNLTSHTYEEDVAEEVVAIFPQFSQELAALITRMSK